MALIDSVVSKVKDDSGRLTVTDDYQPAITAALERYSVHRPREVVVDVTGTGGHDVTLPASWVDEFSTLRSVEYPVDEVPAEFLTVDEWTVYNSPAGKVLRLVGDTPAETDSLRLTITVPRAEAQIKTGDTDAVASLAASFCLDTLANLFASANDPTIMADVVNYRTKSVEYASRAKALRRLYRDHVGIDEDGGAPASMTVVPPPAGGIGLTHWRR